MAQSERSLAFLGQSMPNTGNSAAFGMPRPISVRESQRSKSPAALWSFTSPSVGTIWRSEDAFKQKATARAEAIHKKHEALFKEEQERRLRTHEVEVSSASGKADDDVAGPQSPSEVDITLASERDASGSRDSHADTGYDHEQLAEKLRELDWSNEQRQQQLQLQQQQQQQPPDPSLGGCQTLGELCMELCSATATACGFGLGYLLACLRFNRLSAYEIVDSTR
jgi:hypothetical protein